MSLFVFFFVEQLIYQYQDLQCGLMKKKLTVPFSVCVCLPTIRVCIAATITYLRALRSK